MIVNLILLSKVSLHGLHQYKWTSKSWRRESFSIIENALINVDRMMELENHLLPSHHKNNCYRQESSMNAKTSI